jgi:trk system potassium uptake protein TrkH
MKKKIVLVFFAWFTVCLLGALPYYFSGKIPRFTDAVFESTSGFTTTGATVLARVEDLPGWLLFYRAMTQWLGGIGIILLITVAFPRIGGGGFLVNKVSTSSLENEKYLPRTGITIGNIIAVYTALTLLEAVLLFIFGMNWFDALAHALSTVSTGGFSTRSSGIGSYNSPAIEWIFTVFMFVSGLNFLLFVQILQKRPRQVLRNSELKTYTGIILAAGVICAVSLCLHSVPAGTAIRQSFFQSASFLSTSGFYSANYTAWYPAAQGALFFMLFIGGCSGSAAGGIKVIRLVILSRQTVNESRRLIIPHGVFSLRLNGKGGKKDVVYGVAGFVFLYFIILFLAAVLVSSSGADVFTSLNTALFCQGNVGSGLAANTIEFPPYVKWGLSLVMIAGRLELWPVLVLFTKDIWRK